MTSGLEAVGDAATGALVASALEPGHGATGKAADGRCANCQAPLVGAYCHGCGQNSHLHRSLAGFGHDLVHSVFHFEGKFWTTLPMLFVKPGELTRRYIHGERAKFVSPVAMFLFCIFLMFAVVGGLAGQMHAPEASKEGLTLSAEEIRAAIADNKAEKARIERDMTADALSDAEAEALDRRLDQLDADTDSLDLALRVVSGGREGKGWTMFGFKTGNSTIDQGIKHANENPNLFLYQLKTSAYKYSWMLIPISTPLVWLMFFWKRQYRLYDHLVFVTFSLIFMSLMVTVLTLGSWVGVSTGIIALIALIATPFHMYKQLRGAYHCGRAMALVRTATLLVFAWIALSLYLIILLAMGVMQ